MSRCAMRVAIVHYHLNRGGVAQVIVNHLRALDAIARAPGSWRVAVFYGGRREDWPEELAASLPGVELSLHVVPGLEYDQGSSPRPRPKELADELVAALAAAGMMPGETVLHVHNHSLGKNVSLPGALGDVARAGYALVLHIHDFPEDFRPETYRRLLRTIGEGDPERLCALLYPQSPGIHYAVLNRRDFEILRSAGVAASRLHALPNPVAELGRLPPKDVARNRVVERFPAVGSGHFVLYPVRGIRRKNLGEALLWSALADGRVHFALTQAPLNPVEHPNYGRWKGLAADLALPFLFEVGNAEGLSYHDNLAAADAIVTTSVAEGFGMVFLESWLAGRPLIGRDLPEITADYREAGVRLDTLYPRLAIPLDWIGKEMFRAEIERSYRQALADFGQAPPSDAEWDRSVESLIQDGAVDFASLTPRLQGQVVRRVVEQAGAREAVLDGNPIVARSLADLSADPSPLVTANGEAVRTHFSLESSGRRLARLYMAALASPKADRIDPPAAGMHVVRSFLNLRRFHPVRVEA